MLFSNKLLVAVLTMAIMATYPQAQDLLKTDPEVIKLCDKNGDGAIKKREYLCYLDLKKKKAKEELKQSEEELKQSEEELKQSEDERKNLQKIRKILSNK